MPMNDATLRERNVIVERAVRPVRVSLARQRRIREKLLTHLVSIFEEQAEQLGDEGAALEQAKKRFGDPRERATQLQASVPRRDGLARLMEPFLNLRPGESVCRSAIRGAVKPARSTTDDVHRVREMTAPRITTMPKCRVCNYDVHPNIGQCPHCGAPMEKPNADLEQQVRSLLDQGQKFEAVKLYKGQTGASLREAKQAVEAMQVGADPPSPPHTGSDLESELLRLLGDGQKIQAVKLYKDQKGTSLLEAKQAVESLAARHGLVTQQAGCLGALVVVVMAAVAFGMTIC